MDVLEKGRRFFILLQAALVGTDEFLIYFLIRTHWGT